MQLRFWYQHWTSNLLILTQVLDDTSDKSYLTCRNLTYDHGQSIMVWCSPFLIWWTFYPAIFDCRRVSHASVHSRPDHPTAGFQHPTAGFQHPTAIASARGAILIPMVVQIGFLPAAMAGIGWGTIGFRPLQIRFSSVRIHPLRSWTSSWFMGVKDIRYVR